MIIKADMVIDRTEDFPRKEVVYRCMGCGEESRLAKRDFLLMDDKSLALLHKCKRKLGKK